MNKKITDFSENIMLKPLFSMVRVATFICLALLPLVAPQLYAQENLVTFSLQNRRVEAGEYRAELWARVSSSASWTVPSFQVHINFDNTTLSVSNMNLLDPDPQINAAAYVLGNEPLLKQRRSVSNRIAVIVDAISISGVQKTAGSYFRIGTMRWAILNGVQTDNPIFNDSVTSVGTLAYNTNSLAGWGVVTPASYVVNITSVTATIASVVAPQLNGVPFTIPVTLRNQAGGVEPVTQATVVGVQFAHPNLSVVGGSTQGTINAGQSTTTLNLTLGVTGSENITTTFTVQSNTLPAYVIRGSQNITIQGQVSSASDIVLDPAFTTSATIAYNISNNQGAITANAQELARFVVRDGAGSADGDLVPTIVTGLSISLTNPTNVNTVGLYQGTTLLAQQPAAAQVTFAGITLQADENSSTTFSVRATFTSSVTDKQTVWVAIANVTTAQLSSRMFQTNGGGAGNTSGNEINVQANRLVVTQQPPAQVGVNLTVAPSVSVIARDALGNTDIDWSESATISVTSGTATIGTGAVTTATLGVATFNGLSFSTTGASNTLWVSSTSLSVTVATTSIDVIGLPAVPGLLTPANNAGGIPIATNVQWETIGGFNAATTYTVQVSLANDFSTFVTNSTQVSTSSSLSLLNGTQYWWRVRANNIAGSSAWATASFTTVVGVPVLLAPANGTINAPVNTTASWSSVTGATFYAFQLSTQNTFTTIAQEGTTASLTTNFSGLANSTQYWWRVRATDASLAGAWSSPFTFSTIIATPGAVALVSPVNNAGGVATSLTAIWQSTTGAATYEFQLSTSNTFATTVQTQDNASTGASISGLTNFTEYWWRVRAKNLGGNSAWSTAAFTTVVGVPTLISPANNAVAVTVNPTFTWGSVAGATTYTVQVDLAGTFTSPTTTLTTTAVTAAVSGLSNSTQYFWRVRAQNAQGTGAWSSSRDFTTIEPAPTAPTIVSPVNNAVAVALTTTLTWTSGLNSPNFEIQVATTAGFSQTIVNTTVATTTYTFTTELNNNTSYWWRVRGVNSSNVASAWVTAAFTTVVGTPVLLAPADNATNVRVNTTASWNAVAGANSYNIQVATNSTFTGTLAVNTSTTGTTFAINGLQYSRQYWWRVNAANNDGASLFSASRTFTTEAPPADRLLFVSVNPSTLTSGQAVTVTVQTRNNAGNVMPVEANTTVGVTFGSAFLSAVSGSTNATIVAGASSTTMTFTLVSTSPVDLNSTITAQAAGLTSTTQNISVQSVPTFLTISTSQTSTGNGTATYSFTVTAVDGNGIVKNVTSATSVQLVYVPTGFTVVGASSAVIAAGAQSTTLTLAFSSQNQSGVLVPVTATASGFTSSNANVAIPAFVPPAAALVAVANKSSVQTGETLNITITTVNAFGVPTNVTTATTVQVQLGSANIALASGSLSGTVAAGTQSTTLTFSVNNVSADVIVTSLTVTATNFTGTQASLTIAPAPANRIVLQSITPNPAANGQSVVFTLQAQNQFGVAIAPTTATAITGVVASAGLTINGSVNGNFDGMSATTTITASFVNATASPISTTALFSASSLGSTSGTLTIVSEPATRLAFIGLPSSVTDMQPVNVTVQLQNSLGVAIPATAATIVNVTFASAVAELVAGNIVGTIASGSSSTTLSLTFRNTTATQAVVVLQALTTGLAATTANLNVEPAIAQRFVITNVTPNPVNNGQTLSVTVQARNTYDVAVPVSGATAVNATFAHVDLSLASGNLSGSIPAGANSTTLTFAINNNGLNIVNTNISVSGGLASTTAAVTVNSVPPTALAMTTAILATGNGTRTYQFTVTSVDNSGIVRNVLSNTTVDIDFIPGGFTFAGETSKVIATGNNTVSYVITFANASFSDINLNIGAVTLGLTSTTTVITIPATVPAADRLAINIPASVQSGNNFNVVLTALNSLGNPTSVTSATTVAVNLTLPGALYVSSGVTTGVIPAGQTSTTLSIAIENTSALAQNATLQAVASGLASTSAMISIQPAPADRLAVLSVTPTTVLSGQNVVVQVQSQNRFGVAIAPTAGTTVSATFANAALQLVGGSLTGAFSGVNTDVSLTFAVENISSTVITTSLTVQSNNLSSTGASLTVAPLVASVLAITNVTPAGVVNDNASVNITVQTRNTFGTPVNVTAATTVQLNLLPSAVLLGSGNTTAVIPAGSQNATFTIALRNPTLVNQVANIDISAVGFGTAVTSVTVAPAPAAILTFETGMPQTIPAGTATAPVVVTVRNSFGVQVPFSGTVTLTYSGPGTVVTTTTISASSTATLNGVVLPLAGTWTATASATGLTSTVGTVQAVLVPTALAITGGVPQSKLGGVALDPITVTVRDQFGNPIAVSTTITLQITSGASVVTAVQNIVNATGATFTGITIATDGTWSATALAQGLQSAVSASTIKILRKQVITLNTGWNWVSFNTRPSSLTMATIIAPINSFVQVKNLAGNVYFPVGDIFTLTEWNLSEGVQILVNAPDSLVVIGEAINPATAINLNSGWNFIPYYLTQSRPATPILSSITGISIARTLNGSQYYPSLGLFNFTTMNPGEAYEVFTVSPATLNYSGFVRANAENEGIYIPPTTRIEHPTTDNRSALIVAVDAPDDTEVGAYNEAGQLIASGVVKSGYTMMTVWGDDNFTSNKDGLRKGEQITLKLWRGYTGGEENVRIVSAINVLTNRESDLRYMPNAIVEVQLATLNSAVTGEGFRAFPNPAVESATVRFTAAKAGRLTIEIHDLVGRVIGTVTDEDVKTGAYEYNLNVRELPSGMYRLVAKMGTDIQTTTLVVRK